ncbi:MAG: Nif3-like dinuclear metal center hexameric protein [bacterium]
MIINDLIKYYESWSPPGAAWEKDNVGLQVGNLNDNIKNIFLCLELTISSLEAAIKKNCNLILTHHPLIFSPLKKIDTTSNLGLIISLLIKNNITVYSSHTNLDFVKGGVSFELAKQLKLDKLKFLTNLEKTQYKMAVFIPQENVETVAEAIFTAGGGIIGEYERCSFSSKGEGTFKGSSDSNPTIGTKQKFQTVNEIKLEAIIDSWKLNTVLSAMIKAHPYEEPAYDIYPLLNKNVNFGAGVIGTLKEEMCTDKFLSHVTKSLNINTVKFCEGKTTAIKTVAVCGGSGADLISSAIKAGADAFITADIKYHAYHDAAEKILLIDAGHYETEIFGLRAIKRNIEEYIDIKDGNVEIHFYEGSTNPAKFYNNIGEN